MLRVHLKVSKCEQFGQGVDVFIGRTEDELCLVVAVLNYIPQKGEQLGPFFHFGDRNTLTKVRFTTKVCDALAAVGVECTSYSGHSFRIGAATTVAMAGVADSVIQALGRWSSTPREQLAGVARVLARTN